jgi:hypothetical protein
MQNDYEPKTRRESKKMKVKQSPYTQKHVREVERLAEKRAMKHKPNTNNANK